MYAFAPARLVEARTRARLSREQVAVLTNVSAPSVVAHENGTRAPRGAVLIALADALDIDPRELYEETEPVEAAR